MTHVVTESCIKCKYTDCVTVCPVDCFHEGENMLVIDPHVCIDCGVCVAECPVNAIVLESPDTMEWLKINRDYSHIWPQIKHAKNPLPDADKYADIKEKKDLLSPKSI